MDNLISSHIENSVLYIQFNRPEKKNALTSEMYNELTRLFNQASEQNDIHVVALYGSDECFTAGNDLNDFITSAQSEELAAVSFVKTLVKFEKPLIAAVAGPAVGIGTTILLHCDYVVAATDTFFKLPFTQLGLCPEAASSLLLPQLTGHAKAFEYLVLGKPFNETQALSFGLVNQSVQSSELFSHMKETATTIANLPNAAVMASKSLMKAANKQAIIDSTNLEFDQFLKLLNSDDCQQIIQALVKR